MEVDEERTIKILYILLIRNYFETASINLVEIILLITLDHVQVPEHNKIAKTQNVCRVLVVCFHGNSAWSQWKTRKKNLKCLLECNFLKMHNVRFCVNG